MKRLNKKSVKREFFHSTRHYDAAMYAIDICNNMITRSNRGDIIFEFEQLVKPKFELRFTTDGQFTGLVVLDGEQSHVVIVGDQHHHDSGLIIVTKRDIREYFKLWRVAEITNVNKVSDLTR